MSIYTWQDFIAEPDVSTAVATAISRHKNSSDYKTAVSADNYDRMQNETIKNFVQKLYTDNGTTVKDFTASNNKLCSNFFHRLNTQKCMYLLGNGVSFTQHVEEVVEEDGTVTKKDKTKEKLGKGFDTALKEAAYNALIHKMSFGYWNVDKLYVFKYTEFVPLFDEESGALRAGIRFWQLEVSKPMTAVLYEEDGYTKFRSEAGGGNFRVIEEKRKYVMYVSDSQVDSEEIVGEDNYGTLPIIPLWGSRLRQSTLIGMKEKIDAFDLIRSGFANDLTDCAQIYWILENTMGMTSGDLARFRDRLKIHHMAVADTANSSVTPYTQDIPYQARKEFLDEIRNGIYEDFGALDVHTVAAGATNDHIDAAYQPQDEEADDFEYQIIQFIEQLLNIVGIEDEPMFKRNRISNEKEQTEMILSASDYLDDETILKKLPFISVDEVSDILARRYKEQADRFATGVENE